MHPSRYILGICLCLSILSGCSGVNTGAAEQESREHLRRGNYYLAFKAVEDVGETDPGRPAYRAARLAYLISRGQDLVFADRESEAIEEFERALEIDPDNGVARRWIEKAKRKLADRAVTRGDEHRASGELREALLAYREAEDYVPDYAPALAGAKEVAKTVRRRKERAQDHYILGVDALGESLFGVSWYHMVNAIEIDPGHDRARERRDQVADRLLRDRYEAAKELEKTGHHGAALQEYQDLRQRATDLEGIEERIARCEREVQAARLVEEAEMALFRDELDEAREQLEQAYDLTTSEKARVGELLILVRERELDRRYEKARIAELEHDYETALEGFRAIDETWEGFKDVKARISSLEAAIRVAGEAWEQGQKKEEEGDLEAAISYYDEALLAWPGYRDLDAKLAELRARLQERQEGGEEGSREP